MIYFRKFQKKSFCTYFQRFYNVYKAVLHQLVIIKKIYSPKRRMEDIISMNISKSSFIPFQNIFIVNKLKFIFLSKVHCFHMFPAIYTISVYKFDCKSFFFTRFTRIIQYRITNRD